MNDDPLDTDMSIASFTDNLPDEPLESSTRARPTLNDSQSIFEPLDPWAMHSAEFPETDTREALLVEILVLSAVR